MKSILLIVILILLSIVTAHADEKAVVKEVLATLSLDTAPLVLLKADAGDDATSNLILAEASFQGVVLVKSNGEALKWYLRAAERGSAMAENSVGYLYDNGLGVIRNPSEAAAWYLKAAQHGYPCAWFNIANCYEYGVGVPQDIKKAVLWYEKSAKSGDVEAQLKLAALYESGVVDGSEPEQGYEWLKRAAESGSEIAIQKLTGLIFEHNSDGGSVLENFMDDIVSLLPTELATTIGAHKKSFLEYAVFPIRYDYWQRRIPGKDAFLKDCLDNIRRLRNPKNSYNDSVTHLLGNNIRTLLEIALSSSRYDPLNEDLQRSMLTFVQNGNDREYSINYLGYKPQSLESAVARLYELRNEPKANVYPQLVVATADLWATIWKESGHDVKTLPYIFVRKSLIVDSQY